jgi:hypothetical protein
MPIASPRHTLRRLARAALCLAALAAPGVALAADAFPKLRYGEWEFTRSVPGQAANVQSLSMRECLDPGRSMRDQNAMLEKVGCKFDPPQVAGKVYTYVARCDVPDVGKTVARSVLTVENDSAYTISVESEGVMQGKPMKTAETMTAKRLGNCKKK